MHGAREQSFRFRKDLGLPNQVCLFRWAQYSDAMGGVQMEQARHSGGAVNSFEVNVPSDRSRRTQRIQPTPQPSLCWDVCHSLATVPAEGGKV